MKKVLFVLQSAASGGSNTSMLNLLEQFKNEGQETDLFLMQHEGAFIDRAKDVANLLSENKSIASVLTNKSNLKKRGIGAYAIRLLYILRCRLFGVKKTNEKLYKSAAKKLSGKYDTVVAYQESLCTEFCQYIECQKKVAWIHSNYERFSVGKTTEHLRGLYEKYNEIVCVSDAARKALLENLTLDEKRVHLIRNIIPREYILSQSQKNETLPNKKTYTFASMGRFTYDKAFERAVYAAKRLKENNVDFVWYIMGQGEDFDKINQSIKEEKIENCLLLLGVKKNPFPYIKQADCFVMTSRFEAQPMVLNEALTLGVPVISTEFLSAHEVVNDGVNGIVVENSNNGVLEGILRFISDETLRNELKDGAGKFRYDNESIMKNVKAIL